MFDGTRAEAEYLRDGFGPALDAAGFGLIQDVKKRVLERADEEAFGWRFEVARLPVKALGADRPIDLILRGKQTPTLIAARVVHVDPKRVRWGFVAAGPSSADRDNEPFTFDQVRYKVPNVEILTKAMLDNAFQVAGVPAWPMAGPVYHQGLADEGAGVATDLGPVLDSACVFHNALIDTLNVGRQLMGLLDVVNVLPLVVTNAPLLGLEAAPEADGAMAGQALPWVYVQHHQAHGAKHGARRAAYPDRLPALLDLDFLRTVPVVQAEHLADCLCDLESKLP